jgi:hypothetical protein
MLNRKKSSTWQKLVEDFCLRVSLNIEFINAYPPMLLGRISFNPDEKCVDKLFEKLT